MRLDLRTLSQEAKKRAARYALAYSFTCQLFAVERVSPWRWQLPLRGNLWLHRAGMPLMSFAMPKRSRQQRLHVVRWRCEQQLILVCPQQGPRLSRRPQMFHLAYRRLPAPSGVLERPGSQPTRRGRDPHHGHHGVVCRNGQTAARQSMDNAAASSRKLRGPMSMRNVQTPMRTAQVRLELA